MSEQETEDLTFTGVYVYRRNHVIVSSIVDSFAEENQDHAFMCHRIDGKWKYDPIEYSIAGSCVIEEPNKKILYATINGQIVIPTKADHEIEEIDTSEWGPSDSVFLRCIRVIGKHAYVAGMARQVYRRESVNHWVRWDEGVFVPRGRRGKAVGFNSLDGLAENNIYAVGYKGEIWKYDGAKWIEQESPTNVTLNRVKSTPSGLVFACGMTGTIVRGRQDAWEPLSQDVTTEDFWGLAYFRDKVYLSNYEGLFVVEGDEVKRVTASAIADVTTAYIDAADDVLWSVGQKDIAYTEDGRRWIVVESPVY